VASCSPSKTLTTCLPVCAPTAPNSWASWSSTRTAIGCVTSADPRALSLHWPSSSAEGCRRGAVHQRLLRHLELTERRRCSLRVCDLDNARIRNIYRTAYDGAAQLGGARGDKICVGY